KDAVFFAIVFAINAGVAYTISPVAEVSQIVPVFSALRMDEALGLVDFALAVLAGLGVSYVETFQWIGSTKTERAGIIAVPLFATAVCHQGAAVLSQMTVPGVDWWRSPRSFRVLLVVSACVAGLRLLQLLSRRQWVVAASLLIAIDLVSFNYGYIPFNRAETIYAPAPLFDFLSQRARPFRVVSVDSAAPANTEYVYGLSTVGGYEYMLKRMSSLAELMDQPANGFALGFTSQGIIASEHRILDLLNVRY